MSHESEIKKQKDHCCQTFCMRTASQLGLERLIKLISGIIGYVDGKITNKQYNFDAHNSFNHFLLYKI